MHLHRKSPEAVFTDAKFVIYDLYLHQRRHFCPDLHLPWDQMIMMKKSAILLVIIGGTRITSTSKLFMNTENLHQEILDYLVANIWSRSIPPSEFGLRPVSQFWMHGTSTLAIGRKNSVMSCYEDDMLSLLLRYAVFWEKASLNFWYSGIKSSKTKNILIKKLLIVVTNHYIIAKCSPRKQVKITHPVPWFPYLHAKKYRLLKRIRRNISQRKFLFIWHWKDLDFTYHRGIS